MLYAGLDLSRKRLDFHPLDGEGATVEIGAAAPDADGLHVLTERLGRHGAPIRGAIESMNGARFAAAATIVTRSKWQSPPRNARVHVVRTMNLCPRGGGDPAPLPAWTTPRST